MRVCSEPGCPTLVTTGYCDTHRRAHDKARGTNTQRGYGAEHRAERRRWAPQVAAGTVRCARCHHRITPDERWHLDHTDDRTAYLGPSHMTCNLSAAGRAAHP